MCIDCAGSIWCIYFVSWVVLCLYHLFLFGLHMCFVDFKSCVGSMGSGYYKRKGSKPSQITGPKRVEMEEPALKYMIVETGKLLIGTCIGLLFKM